MSKVPPIFSVDMSRSVDFRTEVLTLDGYQNLFTPSKKYNNFGLQAIIEDELYDAIQAKVTELEPVAIARAKKGKKAVFVAPDIREVAAGQYLLKFSWKEARKPVIVDSSGEVITKTIPVYAGSRVKLAFNLVPYCNPQGVAGISFRLVAVQIVSVSTDGTPSLTGSEAASLFGAEEGGFTLYCSSDSDEEGLDEEEEDEDPF